MTLSPHLEFQHVWASGLILNVGSDGDRSDFKSRGAINIDGLKVHPTLGYDMKANHLAQRNATRLRREI